MFRKVLRLFWVDVDGNALPTLEANYQFKIHIPYNGIN